MGFFEDEDIADLRNAEVSPFTIPAGEDVPVYVEESKPFEDKKNNENVWVITFREAVERDGKPSMRRHSEWLRHPKYVQKDTQKEFRRGKIKQVLTALGVSPNRLNEVEPSELLGIEGTLRLVERNGFKNFARFKVTEVVTSADVGDFASVSNAGSDDYF